MYMALRSSALPRPELARAAASASAASHLSRSRDRMSASSSRPSCLQAAAPGFLLPIPIGDKISLLAPEYHEKNST